jgi:hypothetical protein
MDRERAAREAYSAAWRDARDVPDRIERLERVAAEHPGEMMVLSDIAVSHLQMGDLEGAVQTHREIIDRKDTFEHIRDNVLGLSYMFTGDAARAVEVLEASNVHCWEQGLHLALAYLMDGRGDMFEERFDEWVSGDLRRTYEFHQHRKVMDALLSGEDVARVEEVWEGYREAYQRMSHYERYLTFRSRHLENIGYADSEDGQAVRLGGDEEWYTEDDEEDDGEGDGEGDEEEDGEWDWEPKIPARLSEVEFYALMDEYLYLDHKANADEVDDGEWDRHEELSGLLHAYATID